jgi:Xaa-Pro aminopeptidase
MVTTIEPGVYIAPGSKGVRREWWGIGVRIEDDVAVTAGDPEVLTDGMPTDPEEIERLMAAA